jgi:hypothetical protein
MNKVFIIETPTAIDSELYHDMLNVYECEYEPKTNFCRINSIYKYIQNNIWDKQTYERVIVDLFLIKTIYHIPMAWDNQYGYLGYTTFEMARIAKIILLKKMINQLPMLNLNIDKVLKCAKNEYPEYFI